MKYEKQLKVDIYKVLEILEKDFPNCAPTKSEIFSFLKGTTKGENKFKFSLYLLWGIWPNVSSTIVGISIDEMAMDNFIICKKGNNARNKTYYPKENTYQSHINENISKIQKSFESLYNEVFLELNGSITASMLNQDFISWIKVRYLNGIFNEEESKHYIENYAKAIEKVSTGATVYSKKAISDYRLTPEHVIVLGEIMTAYLKGIPFEFNQLASFISKKPTRDNMFNVYYRLYFCGYVDSNYKNGYRYIYPKLERW